MKVTLEWLRAFTPISQDIKTFCDGMTLSGSKVEGHETLGEAISGVVTALIVNMEKHPDADKLLVCQCDTGSRQLQIVTGATNVRPGAVIPLAQDGATLANGVVIRSGLLRGVLSDGMMCSVSELGFTTADFPEASGDGIFLLDDRTPIGRDICEVLHLDDPVIDFEITSNRVDCFSVEGLAREAAVTFDLPFQAAVPQVQADASRSGPASADLASIEVAAPDLCYRYCGRVVCDVKIEPSPEWLRRRLRGAGLRPINNIVDITNYVMLELGQPMHAFDLDQVADQRIIVRRATDGEPMRTLDSVDRQLDASMLVIADTVRAVGLAGVMGAENSEITAQTRTLLFESATFNPMAVRQAAKKLGLRTEASSRFEKGLDVHNSARAIDRACELVEQLGAGTVCRGMIDIWPYKPETVVIAYTPDAINRLLGTQLSGEWISGCFSRLGIQVDCASGTNTCQAVIPSYRPDLNCVADLAEEAARFYGYNKIEPSLLSGKQTTLGGRTVAQKTIEKIKDIMIAGGFYEAITYAFESPKEMDRLLVPLDHALRQQVSIQNPIGEDYSVMRTSMLPSLLEVAATNWNRSVDAAAVFEIAFVYQPKSLPLTELPDEIRHLTAFTYGNPENAAAGQPVKGSDSQSAVTAVQSFYALKGLLDALFLHLGIKEAGYREANPADCPWLHPSRVVAITLHDQTIGLLGEIHPAAAEKFGVAPRTVLLDLELEPVIQAATEKRIYRALPRYPAVTRDIALIVDQTVPAIKLEQAIRAGGGAYLEQVGLFDVYQGPQLAAGKKSLAYSLVFRADDRTLSEETIAPFMQRILELLQNQTGAQRRE